MLKTLIVLAATSAALAPLGAAAPHAAGFSTEVQALIKADDAENIVCRGNSGDDPATDLACSRRDEIEKELQARKVCWGPESAIEADKHWLRCRS